MKLIEDNSYYNFILGDCLSIMKEMDSGCVNCIITSPPYWGMRRYDNSEDKREVGNEKCFSDYVKILTEIFCEAQRVLTADGSLWLNLGDKYENKQLIGMPWRVAISLIDKGGWILRNDVIWDQLKGTQSCKDRLRDSYEHFFHFVKNKKYYYDGDAIRIKPEKEAIIKQNKVTSSTGVSGVKYRKIIEESVVLNAEEKANALKALDKTLNEIKTGVIHDFRMTIRGAQRAWHSDDTTVSGRAKELEKKGYYVMKMQSKGHLPSDIWRIVTEDTWRKDSHCAVFPKELLTIPIVATCPKNGIVLDPFSGTGTTIVAALSLGRKGVGIDLSEEYIKVSKNRIKNIPLWL